MAILKICTQCGSPLPHTRYVYITDWTWRKGGGTRKKTKAEIKKEAPTAYCSNRCRQAAYRRRVAKALRTKARRPKRITRTARRNTTGRGRRKVTR